MPAAGRLNCTSPIFRPGPGLAHRAGGSPPPPHLSSDQCKLHSACLFLSGVGLDFNTELVESITKVKGANYFAVHSPGEFRRRLVDEFDYAVT